MSSPVTSRKRSRDSDTSSPLSRLLEQLKRLRVPVIDPAQANALLGPLVLECLKVNNDTAFGCILQSYGWQHEAFVLPVNLFGLSTALSKYRWVRVQELGSGSYAVVYKAKNRETDEIIALKKLRFGFDDQGLPSSTLREISLLKMLKHENIVECVGLGRAGSCGGCKFDRMRTCVQKRRHLSRRKVVACSGSASHWLENMFHHSPFIQC